jgi:hypothetical protein
MSRAKEQAIAGLLISQPQLIHRVVAKCDIAAFTDPLAGEVVRTVERLVAADLPCDLVCVNEDLCNRGLIDAVGGAASLAGLTDLPASEEQLDKYATAIDRAYRKTLAKRVVAEAAQDDSDPETIISRLRSVAEGVDLTRILAKIRSKKANAFPEKFLNVPGLVGLAVRDFVETAHKPQPILALGAAISFMAVLCARKITDTGGNRPNVYCCGIADSGAGKDHARQRIKKLLMMCDVTRLHAEGVRSSSGLVNALVQEPAILFLLDEYGREISMAAKDAHNNHKYEVISTLLKLYSSSGSSYESDRYADPKAGGKKIEYPHAVVWATSVPKSFFESLTIESVTDGFLARTLVFASADDPRRRIMDEKEPEPALVDLVREWTKTPSMSQFTGDAKIITCPITPEARKLSEDFIDIEETEKRKAGGVCSTIWSRAGQNASRLALIYAASRPGEKVIDIEAARWGHDLAEWLTRDLIRMVMENIAGSGFHRICLDLMREVRRLGGIISRTEISRHLRMDRRKVGEVIDHLVDSGEIELVREETGGRRRESYRLAEEST